MEGEYDLLGKGSTAKVFRVWLGEGNSIIVKISNKCQSIVHADYGILKLISQRVRIGIPICLKKWNYNKYACLAFVDTNSTSLFKVLRDSEKSLDIRYIFRQVFTILYKVVKECEVYHCDIKSQNIVIDEKMNCTIIDWTDVHLSKKKVTCFKSTLHYASPEAVAMYFGHRTSYNAELLMTWSLRILLYEMYFTELPFLDFDKADIIAAGVGNLDAIDRIERYLVNKLYDAPVDIANLIWNCLSPVCRYRYKLKDIEQYIDPEF